MNGVASDNWALKFVQSSLPTAFQVVRKGQDSRFFRLIEKTFQLLNDLQFCCLPYDFRGLCVNRYIQMKTADKREEMQHKYDTWIDKETDCIEKKFGRLDKLPQAKLDLIPLVRRAVLHMVYEEQEALKQDDPFHSFLSICDPEGKRNESYIRYTLEKERTKALARKHFNKSKIQKVERFTTAKLQEKGLTKPSKNEQQAVDKAMLALTESLLAVSLEETTSSYDYFLFDFTEERLKVVSDVTGLAKLSDKRAMTEEFVAKHHVAEKYKKFIQKERKLFEELYGFKVADMAPELREFYTEVRAIIYRLIYEEQLPGEYPFISICAPDGSINEKYWLDLLNAKARKNNEKPCDDYCDLEKLTDYDVMRIHTAPPKSLEDGKTDPTNLRKTGAVTPDFCADVLKSMKEFANSLKSRTRADSRTDESCSWAKAIFLSPVISEKEKMMFLQDVFCSVLSFTNYVRGDTKNLLSKINITFNPVTQPLAPNLTDRRKSQTPLDPELLRKSADQISPSTRGWFSSRSLTPRAITPRSGASSTESSPRGKIRGSASCASFSSGTEQEVETTFEEDCAEFQKDLESFREMGRQRAAHVVDPSDEYVQYFQIYARNLKLMGDELNVLGNMLQLFAKGLELQEHARQESLKQEGIRERRRGGSGRSPRLLSGGIPQLKRGYSVSSIDQRIGDLLATGNGASVTIPPLALEVAPQEVVEEESPRIANMSPKKFTDTGNLFLLFQHILRDVSQLIADDIAVAIPSTPQKMASTRLEDDYLL